MQEILAHLKMLDALLQDRMQAPLDRKQKTEKGKSEASEAFRAEGWAEGKNSKICNNNDIFVAYIWFIYNIVIYNSIGAP